jgi:hypothetical protein
MIKVHGYPALLPAIQGPGTCHNKWYKKKSDQRVSGVVRC